jgi:hypothetical protein
MYVRRWLMLTTLLAAIALAVFYYYPVSLGEQKENLALALLVPDHAALDDAQVMAWLDAAKEEGIQLDVLTASTFLRPYPFNSARYAGLILPDSIHNVMSEALIAGVHNYAKAGGKVMLVFDAGTLLFPSKTYAKNKSLFADMAGIDYALYDDLKEAAIDPSPVFGQKETLLSLHIPPGKFYTDDVIQQSEAMDPVKSKAADEMSLFAYQYDELKYSHFVTKGSYSGKPLLYARNREIIAGLNPFYNGQVLFVNLPLGYLKSRTDGLLLHGFLRYFAVDIVNLPFLSSAPNGRGGLVMNLHVDSNADLPVLEKLKKKTKLFKYGPYSIHITAGPDVNRTGDGLGFNIAGNEKAKKWVKYFEQRKDMIGSHGGWIHNFFGYNVNDSNQGAFEPYLIKNKLAIESLTNAPVTEYSAPVGNHPLWVTQWLDSQHITSYYFTGDMGMGPTKPYRNEQRQSFKAWAFPVLNMGKYAAFEEMHAAGVHEKTVAKWLNDITDFTANDQVVRLMYLHPPGILHYLKAANAWLLNADRLDSKGKFSWYTMTDIANFMNEREKVVWSFSKLTDNEASLSAFHAQSLSRQTWMLPKARYEKPAILQGKAEVIDEGKFWLIKAGEENRLMLTIRIKSGDPLH